MRARSSTGCTPSRRRATVLIMVVGVLAMLFIIGSSLLLVSRFELGTARNYADGRNIAAAGVAITDPIIAQLREDAVGTDPDNVPYNRPWNATEPSLLEDYGDLVGLVSPETALLVRNGDLLLASPEPYYDPGQMKWFWFATSWGTDQVDQLEPPDEPVMVGIAHHPWCYLDDDGVYWPTEQSPPYADADGDGLVDGWGPGLSTQAQVLTGMFGGTYNVALRVVPHGGMVLLDRYTHPSLLAQVIHPQDAAHTNPLSLWSVSPAVVINVAIDEGALRRRFWLPANLLLSDLKATDIRNKLPVTLGYIAPSGASDEFKGLLTPHWWAIDEKLFSLKNEREAEQLWWEQRLTPGSKDPSNPGESGLPLTDKDYSAASPASDLYDRRHLITTINSDDILRRVRDEVRLGGVPAFTDPSTGELEEIINPPAGAVGPGPALLQYGRDATGQTRFNGPGLRTQFSLRDVLEPTGSGSYRRAVQLTAYFLAMIQHTTVPGSAKPNPGPTPEELTEQLRTAAQMAVNTIDFADADLTPTYFKWSATTPPVEVVGVEKQPFITEAYAKIVFMPKQEEDPPNKWVWDNQKTESIYAVELYNPYGVALVLDNYELVDLVKDKATGATIGSLDLATLNIPGTPPNSIPPRTYIVIASRADDTALGKDPFIDGATTGTNLIVPSLPADQVFKINEEEPVVLRRKAGTCWAVAPPPTGDALGGPTDGVEVDQLKPLDLPHLPPGSKWAEAPKCCTYRDADPENGIRRPGEPDKPGGVAPPPVDDRLVRDTTLQRHKETYDPDPTRGIRPFYWHFTLARQMQMPLKEDEDALVTAGIADAKSRPAQHSLLGNSTTANQQFIRREFVGIEIARTPMGNTLSNAIEGRPAIAPFPIVTADRGVNPSTRGTWAFPTTGTLLLVTRYAHLPKQPGIDPERAVTVAAATTDPITGKVISDPAALAQMEQIDNGHLPIFDAEQKCLDGDPAALGNEGVAQGRPNLPWGQLVFDYFTALPVEEIFRPLAVLSGSRLIDITDEDAYKAACAGPAGTSLFPGYPIVMPVDASSGRTIGPKVLGRINVNFASWWVLDGLPMLNEPAQLPVLELGSPVLDPTGLPANPNDLDSPAKRPGERFLDLLVDDRDQETVQETGENPPLNLANIGPAWAKYMVAYREPPNDSGHDPGFVTVGAMCDLLYNIPIDAEWEYPPGQKTQCSGTLQELRNCENSDHTEKPFAYLGYLQLVAPIVRLSDWVTVKNHVFTIYNTISTTADPRIHLRTQVTVDRTRCLYSNDLPVRVTETEPIGYFNAADD